MGIFQAKQPEAKHITATHSISKNWSVSLSTKKLGSELAEQLIPATRQLYTKEEAQVVMESIYKLNWKVYSKKYILVRS